METNKKPVSELRLSFDKYIGKNLRAKVGIGIIVFFALVAIFADFIAPYSANAIDFTPWEGPTSEHWLGVNSYGQDIFSRLVYGTRVTMLVGIFAGLLSSFIGTFVGLLAGYKGGKTGEVLMRIVDVFLVLPTLAVIIVLSSYVRDMGLGGEILVIGFFSWLMMARSIRSQTLTEARREYVDAARAQGMGSIEIMFKEILTNILPVVTANMVMVITQALLTEASMSFLGLGDAAAVSWGKMLSIAYDNSAILHDAWWWMIPPGLCIATLGFSFMLIGNSFLDIYANDRGGHIKL